MGQIRGKMRSNISATWIDAKLCLEKCFQKLKQQTSKIRGTQIVMHNTRMVPIGFFKIPKIFLRY